jgi:hypothetical protein
MTSKENLAFFLSKRFNFTCRLRAYETQKFSWEFKTLDVFSMSLTYKREANTDMYLSDTDITQNSVRST